MEALFFRVLEVSWSGSFFLLFLALLLPWSRSLLLPRWRAALLALALFRMLLPSLPGSAWSLESRTAAFLAWMRPAQSEPVLQPFSQVES